MLKSQNKYMCEKVVSIFSDEQVLGAWFGLQ